MHFHHVYREANMSIDSIDNFVVSLPLGLHEFPFLFNEILFWLLHDINGIVYPRNCVV